VENVAADGARTPSGNHRRGTLGPLPHSRTTEQSPDFHRTYKAGSVGQDYLWSRCFLFFSGSLYRPPRASPFFPNTPEGSAGLSAFFYLETLANLVVNQGQYAADFIKNCRELCAAFSALPKGQSIKGCTTWTQFVETHLPAFSYRTIQRLTQGASGASEKYRPKNVRQPRQLPAPAMPSVDKAGCTTNKVRGENPFLAISRSPLCDSETWAKDDAVRQILNWTRSCIKRFSLIEKRQIVEDVIVKLRDEMAFHTADAVKAASSSRLPAA
jgi:hypothetical protein